MLTSITSPDKFAAIVSSMPEGVLFLDEQDIIRICNPAAERIRKVSASKIIGQSIFAIRNVSTGRSESC